MAESESEIEECSAEAPVDNVRGGVEPRTDESEIEKGEGTEREYPGSPVLAGREMREKGQKGWGIGVACREADLLPSMSPQSRCWMAMYLHHRRGFQVSERLEE